MSKLKTISTTTRHWLMIMPRGNIYQLAGLVDTLVTNVEEDADLIEFEGTNKKKQRKMVDYDSDSDSDKEEAPTEAEKVDIVPVQQLNDMWTCYQSNLRIITRNG
jgi:hypothetical protein